MRMDCIVDCRNTLGEGCVWDPRDDCVYWTDIEERRIYRWSHHSDLTIFDLPDRAAFLLPRATSGFVVGFAGHIALSDADFTEFRTIATVEAELRQTRINDAAVDPQGGIVFGTFDERDRLPVAGLYRLAHEGSVTKLLDSVAIANGIAFSPDGELMYFADTAIGTIRRFAVEHSRFSVSEISPLAPATIAPGKPDGAVVDAEGNYWSARVWGGCVAQISPDGDLLDVLRLPTKGPTCPALGGQTGTELFVTTLRAKHSPEELQAVPEAGGLYAAKVPIPGPRPRLCEI